MIAAKLHHFSRRSQNAAPATTFDTVSSLRSPDHENSTLATSPNAASVTKIDDAAAQSAAPATKNRRANWDTLLKYCACHAKRKRHRNACHKTRHNHASCDEIDLQEIILAHFASAAQRWGLAPSLRTPAVVRERLRTWRQRWANTTPTSQTSRVKRGPFATHSGKRSQHEETLIWIDWWKCSQDSMPKHQANAKSMLQARACIWSNECQLMFCMLAMFFIKPRNLRSSYQAALLEHCSNLDKHEEKQKWSNCQVWSGNQFQHRKNHY